VRTTLLLAASAVMALSFSGCRSSDDVYVTCEIQRYGKPYAVPDTQSLQVTFYAMETKDESGKVKQTNEPYAAARSSDGKYEVPGPDGRGIPPGKYRIAVIQKPKSTATAPKPKSKNEAPDRDTDYLADKFGPNTSPIVRTIDAKTAQLVIDLESPSD
jgi:hypothetical protein